MKNINYNFLKYKGNYKNNTRKMFFIFYNQWNNLVLSEKWRKPTHCKHNDQRTIPGEQTKKTKMSSPILNKRMVKETYWACVHFMIFRPFLTWLFCPSQAKVFGRRSRLRDHSIDHSLKAPKIHCFSFCDRRGEVARGRWQFRLDRDIPRPPLTENNIWLARSVTKLTFTISKSPFYWNHQAGTFY
jgi:hypothetical protein